MFKKIFISVIVPLAALTSCIGEDNFENSNNGNFEALWEIIDRQYCFFDVAEKKYGLNWNSVYDKYKPLSEACEDDAELFKVLGDMLGELRDGHVNLTSMFGTSYYWDWKLDYPMNFSDSIQRNYLGNDFKLTNGIKYTALTNSAGTDSIGYVYCGSFAGGFSINNLSMMLLELKNAKGLIIDVRNNGGGMVTAAENLASSFTKEKIHCGYIQHKTGPGHNEFSEPEEIYLKPSPGVIWLRPVVVLTNRSVYSAANYFVMLMQEIPHAFILGDVTGGGSGLPLNTTLPNGWSVRLSACPMLDTKGNDTEFGIAPDLRVDISNIDWLLGRDTMIEAAKMLISEYYDKKAEEKAP